MEFQKHEQYKFFPKFERFEPLILDNSAISTFKKCPRMYFFEYVLQYKEKLSPIFFHFGTAYHKYREVLEIEWQKLDDTLKKDNDALQACNITATTKALEVFGKLTKGYDPKFMGKWVYLDKVRLLQSCSAAYAWWHKEKMVGSIVVLAVEQAFNVRIGQSEFFISGRADQVVKWNGRIWGRDWKTTSEDLQWYDRGLNPNHQFTTYSYAINQLNGGDFSFPKCGGIMVEALYNAPRPEKTSKPASAFGPTIRNFTASRTVFDLRDWEQDVIFTLNTIKQAREQDRYPKNETQCKMCKYRSVCTSTSELTQQEKLRLEFSHRIWDNTKTED